MHLLNALANQKKKKLAVKTLCNSKLTFAVCSLSWLCKNEFAFVKCNKTANMIALHMQVIENVKKLCKIIHHSLKPVPGSIYTAYSVIMLARKQLTAVLLLFTK